MKTTLTLLILLTLFSLNTFAQDFPYTTLEGHTNYVSSVAFSPDGKTLASGSSDNTIILWDVATGGYLKTLSGHSENVLSVAFSQDGKILASGSSDNTIRLWDAVTGQHQKILTGHTDSVFSVAFSPDSKILASGSLDNTIRLWDVATREYKTLTEHSENVWSVAFSPDGKTLASGSLDGTIRLWDANTGKHKQRVTTNWDYVLSVAFSPDGQTLASGMGEYFYSRRWGYSYDGDIALWDAATGQHLKTLSGHTNYVLSVAFSPDGKTLASGSSDNTIRLWDAVTGQHLKTLSGHSENVLSVAFSQDGKILASGSSDNTIRLWELHTRVSITPNIVTSPAIGEQFSINVNIKAGANVGGYQFTVGFDSTALRYVAIVNGDYLPDGTFFVPPVLNENSVTLGATSLAAVSNGDGTLATLTFEVVDVKESNLSLYEVILTNSNKEPLPLLTSSSRVVEPSVASSSAIISITPSPVVTPAIGEQLTLNIDIVGGENVVGYNLTVQFDETALQYRSRSSPSSYLNAYVSVNHDGNRITLSSTSDSVVGNGDGTLTSVTFDVLDHEATEVPTINTSTVSVSEIILNGSDGFDYTPIFENAHVQVNVTAPLIGDVNGDGVVNILDLVKVAAKFGQSVREAPEDVNGDGVVNIIDLVTVAAALGTGESAPALHPEALTMLTTAEVQQWLSEAQQLNLTDTTSQLGIRYLEQLLAALTPKETTLLPNYPNPFNPETWMPYQLATPAHVSVSIYSTDGKLIRKLDLGDQPMGIYQGKSRAAHWDGKNELGESVASGVYFYTLTAGEFSATRKMLIRK